MKWPNEWRGWRPLFIGPIGNLPVGMSKIWTCPDCGPNMSDKCL
jgi:hypothetical protein